MALTTCPNCGCPVSDNASFCEKCGCDIRAARAAMNQQASQFHKEINYDGEGVTGKICPPNYLVFAILTTIFCCWPFGIPAIVNAARVNNAFSKGSYFEAALYSANARKWSVVALILGAVSVVISSLVWIFVGAGELATFSLLNMFD